MPDLLVNSAGGQFPQNAIDLSPKGWNAVVSNNLNNTWFVMQRAAQRWRDLKRGGSIVNVIVVLERPSILEFKFDGNKDIKDEDLEKVLTENGLATGKTFDQSTLDLLAILVNQATVAVRNAQLYKQVPLPGFLRPLAERRTQLLNIPKKRRITYAIAAAAILVLLFVIPWRVRVEGPARVVPARRASVTAGVDGIVRSVVRREGDVVEPGEVIATLQPAMYEASLADARAAYQVAESEVARYREAGDSASMFEAAAKRDELKARIAMEEERFAGTTLRAPVGGTIVTPRIEQRVGQFLTKGTELCVIADTGSILAEVAVPENEASLIGVGEPVALKLNPYPTRTFRGVLTRVGSHVRDDGKDRFIVCEAKAANPGGIMKTGMLGKAKVATRKVPIAVALFRKPFRYIWNKVWPLLP